MDIIDCDVHVLWKSVDELARHLPEPYRTHMKSGRRAFTYSGYYNPIGVRRRDATPPNGGSPGSDPAFTLVDLVDRFGNRGEKVTYVSDWEHLTPYYYHTLVEGVSIPENDLRPVSVTGGLPWEQAVFGNLPIGPV